MLRACLLLSLHLALVSLAQADKGPDLLVVGVGRGGRLDARASRVVQKRLERLGEETLVRAQPARAELDCRDARCLRELGRGAAARAVLGGEVMRAERTQVVTLWIYDAALDRVLQDEGHCLECDAWSFEAIIADTAGRLLGRRAAGVLSLIPAGARGVSDQGAGTRPPRPLHRRWWFWTVLSTTAAVAVGAAVGGAVAARGDERRNVIDYTARGLGGEALGVTVRLGVAR